MSGGMRRAVKINVNPNDIADISKRTEYALYKQIEVECSGSTNEAVNSDASNVTFNMGTLKGRTPASVLAEGKGEELEKQRIFLLANVGKYPANQKLINAIDEAFREQAEGELVQTQNVPKMSSICLYSSGLKPQQRRQRSDGKCEVNEMRITWDVGNKYPVTIEITNYYASVLKLSDGRLNVRDADNSSRVTLRAVASEAEWMNILRKIETNMHMFEILQARATFAEAESIYNTILSSSKNTYQKL